MISETNPLPGGSNIRSSSNVLVRKPARAAVESLVKYLNNERRGFLDSPSGDIDLSPVVFLAELPHRAQVLKNEFRSA
eukprot:CAMPEP_0172532642 /NCGR_PEP_ID=MMETSP1067-20121228/5621_1 /TAXON_ID=265564 ORGANISM="Thalassiosira punctigera, Strain Tpunct2005C2" /NCGR_SAMPLE_ID=MMETSP1067 /ASSEMBLY_ACC=CAM_ASM_000444 /LENGTH=77 /DNA_ID=CAMNT_0013317183 /DNA_START=69 /DNA_END=303 /DNA_ORIENTATION=-